MTNIIPFKFKTSDIRVIELNGEPMFVAKDVATLLGYAKPNNAINSHCKGALKRGIDNNGVTYSMVLIPERDVYRLIMRSKMPEAEKFEDWVVSEVLPSIRKTGTYSTDFEVPKTMAESLRLAANLAEKLEEAAPKIAFAEAVASSINSVSVKDFAKAVGTGQNRLFALLRNNGYLMSGWGKNNQPYQRYIDQGLFKVQERVWKDQNGESHTTFKTLVTGKGQQYFQSKFFSNEAA
ncbi:MAG: phage antirepressor KilAC domain-containing protein [Glaciecola sp.]|jgi:anti-repressor protein